MRIWLFSKYILAYFINITFSWKKKYFNFKIKKVLSPIRFENDVLISIIKKWEDSSLTKDKMILMKLNFMMIITLQL